MSVGIWGNIVISHITLGKLSLPWRWTQHDYLDYLISFLQQLYVVGIIIIKAILWIMKLRLRVVLQFGKSYIARESRRSLI